jgi:ABC-type bacteriocin/lantibiotic exporter with double-glycine peptidase domain
MFCQITFIYLSVSIIKKRIKEMIPYYKQETEYTCGAACTRMALASFGIKKSEKQIAKLLKTNKKIGTWHKNIAELAEKYKFNYFVERNGKINDIRKMQKRGWRIIVCYNYEGVPHYAIVKKINWHSIYLLNPLSTKKERYLIPRFKKRWKDREEKQWFIAIKK